LEFRSSEVRGNSVLETLKTLSRAYWLRGGLWGEAMSQRVNFGSLSTTQPKGAYMKRSVVVAALIALCAIRVGAQGRTGTFFVTADKLAINCRASNRVMDGPSPATNGDLDKSDACVNYIRGRNAST
jgi:hypothetical protein